MEDRDFEFPKRESKLDRVRIEWKNLTNDEEKRQYCDELDLKIKEIDKLDKTRKKLGGFLVVSKIILIFCECGVIVSH